MEKYCLFIFNTEGCVEKGLNFSKVDLNRISGKRRVRKLNA